MKISIVGKFKDRISKGLETVQRNVKKTTGGFKRFSQNVGSQMGQARAAVGRFTKGIGTVGVAVGAAATAAVGGLLAITKQATAAGREIQNLSRIANAPVEQFQKLAFGAEQFGISQEKLADQLKDVQDRIGDFAQTGGGPLADFFEQIGPKVGVTIEDFQRLSGPEALQLFQNSLEKANLSQEDMVFYLESVASDLTQLQPLLANNSALLNQYAQEAEDLGLILSEVDVQKLAEGERTFQKLSSIVKTVTNLIGVNLLPFIQQLAENFTNSAKEAGGVGEVVKTVVNGAIRGFGFLGDVLRGLEVVFSGLRVVALGFVGAVVSALQLAFNAVAFFLDGITNNINLVIRGLNELGANIPELTLPSQSGFISSINEIGDNVRGMVTQAVQDLDELALKELPSASAEKFIAAVEARSQADEAAAQKRREAAAEKAEQDRKELESIKQKRLAEEKLAEQKKIADEQAKKAAEDKAKADAAASKAQQTAIDEAIRERTREMEQLVGSVRNVFTTFFKDIAGGSKDAFGNLVSNFKNMVDNLIAEALAAKVMKALFGDILPTADAGGNITGGSTGGLISGFFNSLFGREMGGPVQANMPYIVGEKRPEIFVPRQDGTIIPNLAMAGGGSTQVNINAIDSRGVAEFIESNKFALTSAVQNTTKRYNVR